MAHRWGSDQYIVPIYWSFRCIPIALCSKPSDLSLLGLEIDLDMLIKLHASLNKRNLSSVQVLSDCAALLKNCSLWSHLCWGSPCSTALTKYVPAQKAYRENNLSHGLRQGSLIIFCLWVCPFWWYARSVCPEGLVGRQFLHIQGTSKVSHYLPSKFGCNQFQWIRTLLPLLSNGHTTAKTWNAELPMKSTIVLEVVFYDIWV